MAIFNGLKDNLEWEERNGTEPCNLSTAEKHIQIGWGQKKENWRPAIQIGTKHQYQIMTMLGIAYCKNSQTVPCKICSIKKG